MSVDGFIYDHLPDANELKNQMNPSPVRKRLTAADVISALLPLLFFAALCVILNYNIIQRLRYMSYTIPATAFLIYFILFADRRVILYIRLYQKLASDSIRSRCVFVPTCSEYMILAIEKYGVLAGVIRGIGRLRRCNSHGGGYDFP